MLLPAIFIRMVLYGKSYTKFYFKRSYTIFIAMVNVDFRDIYDLKLLFNLTLEKTSHHEQISPIINRIRFKSFSAEVGDNFLILIYSR